MRDHTDQEDEKMLPLGRNVLNQLIVVTACIHVLLVPYTKVEESFNLHATHDALMYGVGPAALQNVRRKAISNVPLFTCHPSTTTLCFLARFPEPF